MRATTDNVGAVVLAGGVNPIKLFDGHAPGYKAFLSFGGKPAIHYTLAALCGVPQVKRVCIVGPEADLREAVQEAEGYEFAPSAATLMESIFIGLRHFSDLEGRPSTSLRAPSLSRGGCGGGLSCMVLITVADLPLITPQAITDFLAACARIETTQAENVFLAVAPKSCYTGPYEQFPKGFNRFKDVAVCHGNLFLADPRILNNTRATRRMNDLYNARKNPIKAALALGWRVGLSYAIGVHLLHALSMEQMARLVSWRFGVGFIPVVLDHPEVTIDVDEPADYAFVVEQMAR